jgi:hypothetical protein
MAHGASTRGLFLRDVHGTSPDFSEQMSHVASTPGETKRKERDKFKPEVRMNLL